MTTRHLIGLVTGILILSILAPVGLSLWLAACLYLSLLEKSVFNYAFMLSGYTALFVSLPYVNAPQDLFNNFRQRRWFPFRKKS